MIEKKTGRKGERAKTGKVGRNRTKDQPGDTEDFDSYCALLKHVHPRRRHKIHSDERGFRLLYSRNYDFKTQDPDCFSQTFDSFPRIQTVFSEFHSFFPKI